MCGTQYYICHFSHCWAYSSLVLSTLILRSHTKVIYVYLIVYIFKKLLETQSSDPQVHCPHAHDGRAGLQCSSPMLASLLPPRVCVGGKRESGVRAGNQHQAPCCAGLRACSPGDGSEMLKTMPSECYTQWVVAQRTVLRITRPRLESLYVTHPQQKPLHVYFRETRFQFLSYETYF